MYRKRKYLFIQLNAWNLKQWENLVGQDMEILNMFLMFRDTILEVVSLAEYLETDRLCKWQNRKLGVVMGKNTGDGMDLILMWNGVPALSVGVGNKLG